MRKIESEMLDAIKARRSWSLDNTAVTMTPLGDGLVTLHGNLIAQLFADGSVAVTLAGWNTPTTRSRLNALLSICGNRYRVRCVRGDAYLTNSLEQRAMSSTEWVAL